MNPVSLLRSSWAATLALVLVMWAQVPHSKYVFERIITGGQDGWPFALGFEVAVLMFVVRSMHGASWFFAALSALINVKYYEMHGVDMWGGALSDIWGEWLLSLALPFVIAMYSHILAYVQGLAHGTLYLPAWVQMWRMKLQDEIVAGWAKVRGNAPPAIADATLSPAPMQSPIAEAEPTVEDAIADMQAGDEAEQAPLQVDPKERAKQLRSEGLSNNAIAKELQVNPSTVGRWLKEVA